MMMTTTRTAPSAWANALINRDASGLDEHERKHVFEWEREQGLGEPVCVSASDTHGWFEGLRTVVYDYGFLVSIPLDEIVVPAYLEAAKFTDGGPDHPDIEDAEFSEDAEKASRESCEAFLRANLDDIIAAVSRYRDGWASVGHDLWLTRNRHGSGFWDRPELKADGLGSRLTHAAHAIGESHVYLGDTRQLHLE